MPEKLQALGLTSNESIVYEALLNAGPTKAGVLIARLDIHRNIIYTALQSLIHQGLVTKFNRRGVWWFQIADPDILLTNLARKEQIARAVIADIRTRHQKTEQQITVYEGIDSYRAYWLSSLERIPEGTIEYTLGIPLNSVWPKLMGPSAMEEYMTVRARKRIFWKTVFFKLTEEEREIMSIHPELNEYRVLEEDVSPIGNFNVVYDTIILQVMTDEPRIIEIRDKDLVTVFQNYFDICWKRAIPV